MHKESETTNPQAETVSEIATPKLRTIYLSEAASLEAIGIDDSNFTVPVVLINAGWSANKRYYSREALARAIPVFEGAKAFADHPGIDEQKNRPERSVKDITGYYTDVRQRESDGALVGTRHVVGAAREWLWPLIKETIVSKPDLAGLSINAMGKTAIGEAEGRKGIIVEDILPSQFTSVDDVTSPAAGGKYETLRASDNAFTTDLLAAMDYDEWRATNPDFIKRLREELKTQRQDEALKESRAASATLREQMADKDKRIGELTEASRAKDTALSDMRAELARRETQVYADRLIAEAKFPPAWTSAFKPQMMAIVDTGQWPALVETERAKMRLVRPIVEVRGGGTLPLAQSMTQPVAEALGVSIVPLPDDTPASYAARKARLTQRS